MLTRRWRRSGARRAVSPIIGTILILAMTMAVLVIVFSFRFYLPPSAPTMNLAIRTGGDTPVWGDPTDCQPLPFNGWSPNQPNSYPISAYSATVQNQWDTNWWNQCEYFSEALPGYSTAGLFAPMNTTQIIFSTISSNDIPLADLNFTFVCNGALAPYPYQDNTTTVLVTGTLDTMTWNPGLSTTVPADAPLLHNCGGFDMGAEAGVSFGSEFDRLMIFAPIVATPGGQPASLLAVGDTIYVYIHNGGWPLDYACVVNGQPWAGDAAICPPAPGHANGIIGGPLLDVDDYHGAPPWCFSTPGACTIYLTYTGSPSALIATIPVYNLAPPA
jgi:flagellin-like protein